MSAAGMSQHPSGTVLVMHGWAQQAAKSCLTDWSHVSKASPAHTACAGSDRSSLDDALVKNLTTEQGP